MNTGDLIKQLRISNGLTLEELGNKVGVGKSTVRKWETGSIANMRRDKIAKLAEALNVKPSVFICGNEGQNNDTDTVIPESRQEFIDKVLSMSDAEFDKLVKLFDLWNEGR